MKKIISIFSIALMFIVTFGAAINVFATVNTDSNNVVTSTGKITINRAADNDTFVAYKLVDIIYNSSTNTVDYKFNSNFESFLNNHTTEYKTPTAGGTFTIAQYQANQNDVVKNVGTQYITYIKNNTVSGGINFGNNSNPANVVDVPAGGYLISATSTKKVYNLMIANVELESDGNNGYQVKANTTLNAKGTDINNGVISGNSEDEIVPGTDPKTGETVDVVLNDNGDGSDGSYGVGDEVTYDFTVTVPDYPTNSTNKTFIVTADIPETIEFGGLDNVKVIINENGVDKEYTVDTTTGQINKDGDKKIADVRMLDENGNPTTNASNVKQVQIEFNPDEVKGEVKVEFTGVVKENPEVGSPSNVVKVDVEYAPDPYKNETDNADLYIGITTYGLRIDVNAPAGAGSGFITNVYAAPSLATSFQVIDSNNNVVTTINTVDNDVTNTGVGEYKGIAGGNYTVKQVSAISGFKLLGERPITISSSSVQSDDYYVLNLELEKAGLLPSTGGIGTLLFSIIGILVIGMAFYFVIDYRKKKENASAN